MSSRRRVVVAMMSHETNTFSPVVTDLARFSRGGASKADNAPLAGQEAIATFSNTASSLGGYLKVCAEHNAEVIVPVAGDAAPSGPVEDDAYEYMVAAILAAIDDCDAVLLDLHGAMVTKTFDDGEGELLRRIRAKRPALPIAVALDMHANITEQMVSNSSLITGYQTYPHIDMDTTAERAARMLFYHLDGGFLPTMRWGNAPMLPHVMRQGTDDEPNKALQQRVIELESDGATLASLFTGFQAWAGREQFVYEIEPLANSLDRARTAAASDGEGPVIILDHYDNTASGGTMDTTEVLAAVLSAKLEDVAVFGIYDPDCVAQMFAAGIDGEVTLELGGKLPMPALAQQSKPLTVTGRVKLLADGKFPATVAMARGLTMNMGHCAVLRLANAVDVIVISRHIEPFDPGCFRSLGIEPLTRRYVMLKSRVHYRVGFREMAREVIECAGVGVCTSDYSQLTFSKVRRPIYPLDKVAGANAVRRQDF